jgi:DNA-binding winged helix-turn-helix (wHTH) protein/tetratricopeptide (TPR) repeat protein
MPPKTAEVLLALLDRPGALVTKDELMELVWPDTVVEENSLAKHIFLLRKTLGNDHGDVAFIETVPKRGYRFVGAVERKDASDQSTVEYEEHARERIVIEDESKTFTTVGLWLGALAVLTAASGITLLWRGSTQSAGQWRCVLIVPFTTSGGTDPTLASAFTQELAARLRTVRGLRVLSPLAAADRAAIAPPNSADTILTGRLAATGGRLHATAQLRSAHDETVLWAEDASGTATNDLETEMIQLASSIAARLYGRLAPAERASLERRGSTDPQAYDAFLHGKAEMLRKSVDAGHMSARAVAHFESAVRLDPGFADAWAGLARAQYMMWAAGGANRSHVEAALENARRALAIDPNNVAGRDALIRAYLGDGDYEGMLREAKAVLAIDPANPEAQAAAAFAYRFTGMLDRAIALYERYVAANPDDEDAWYQLVHACVFAGAYERGMRHAQSHIGLERLLFPTFLLPANSGDSSTAVSLARRTIASGKGSAAALYFAPLILWSAGFRAEARLAWQRAAETLDARLTGAENENTRKFLAMTCARLGRRTAARQHVRKVWESRPDDPWIGFFVSETHAILGDRAAAFDALRKTIAAGFLGLQYLDYYRQPPNGWYAYRHDPEFVAIRTNLERRISDLRTRY